VLNFYQINRNSEIRTRDRLVNKAMIPCQRTISTQKLNLLDKISGYNLYYFLRDINAVFTIQFKPLCLKLDLTL
jgi:hypothetical protein